MRLEVSVLGERSPVLKAPDYLMSLCDKALGISKTNQQKQKGDLAASTGGIEQGHL